MPHCRLPQCPCPRPKWLVLESPATNIIKIVPEAGPAAGAKAQLRTSWADAQLQTVGRRPTTNCGPTPNYKLWADAQLRTSWAEAQLQTSWAEAQLQTSWAEAQLQTCPPPFVVARAPRLFARWQSPSRKLR
ncbi:MAG: hypothetical protein MUC60_10965 [Oscillatoria sp. Prado101]|nr:hypothetical protein [Oscillatoria sp. Prado101]